MKHTPCTLLITTCLFILSGCNSVVLSKEENEREILNLCRYAIMFSRFYDEYSNKTPQDEINKTEQLNDYLENYYLLLIEEYKKGNFGPKDYTVLGETLLMMASFYGDEKTMNELIHSGADVHQETINPRFEKITAFAYADYGEQKEALQLLLSHRRENYLEKKHSPFQGMIENSYILTKKPESRSNTFTRKQLEEVLINSQSISFWIIIDHKNNILHSGRWKEKLKSYYCHFINEIKNTNDFHKKSIWGDTALQMASFLGDIKTIEYLLDKGVDINELNAPHDNIWRPSKSNDENALHYAAKGRQKEAYDLLIKKGINVSQKNVEGKTPAECWGDNQ